MSTESPRRRVDVARASALIQSNMPQWPATDVELAAAGGQVLREAVSAEREQPPFDRVTMDGIAIRHAAWAAGRREFTVAGIQAAGAAARSLPDDAACIEVMTGTALPGGADTVIPVERVVRDEGSVTVAADYEPRAGQFVHRRGTDHAAGAPLLAPGTRLGPAEMAILTISGKARVAVGRRPRLAVVSTGDELVAPGEPITPFQVRSSNDIALTAALQARGYREVTPARLPDDELILRRQLGGLLGSCDVLILSGGVSMGKFDHVPNVLANLGMRLVLHKVLQRPGMPMWFGVSPDGQPVFALPGNPVSSLVCLLRYVLPALDRAIGATPHPVPRVRLASSVSFEPDLAYFLPVVVEHAADGSVTAVPRPTNTSGDFVSLGGTDGFVELPRGGKQFNAGYAADFYRW
jgi:molybdopterin molybdotransferase